MKPRFWAVYDRENEQAFGPYTSEEAALADIILMANVNGWTDIIEAGDFPFEDTGLDLVSLANSNATPQAFTKEDIVAFMRWLHEETPTFETGNMLDALESSGVLIEDRNNINIYYNAPGAKWPTHVGISPDEWPEMVNDFVTYLAAKKETKADGQS